MGGMQQLGAALLDTARVADQTDVVAAGELALAVRSTQTVDSTYIVTGNTFKMLAQGFICLHPMGSGGGATGVLQLRIEGTVVAQLNVVAPQGDPLWWTEWEMEVTVTCRAGGALEYGSAKIRYGTTVGASAWPSTATDTNATSGARQTNLASAGNVTFDIYTSITNAFHDAASFTTVRKHQVGLGQT